MSGDARRRDTPHVRQHKGRTVLSRPWRILLSGSAMVLVLVGCGAREDGLVLTSDGSSVLVGPKFGSYGGTGGGGNVTMAGRCLGFDGATVLWPYGTTIVTDDPLTIEVPGLGRVTGGDSVYGGVDTFVPGHLPRALARFQKAARRR